MLATYGNYTRISNITERVVQAASAVQTEILKTGKQRLLFMFSLPLFLCVLL